MKTAICSVGMLVIVSASFAYRAPSVESLIKQLKDKDEVVRLKAAKELGKLGTDAKDAIPALTEALKDTDEDVRSVAKKAIALIKDAVAAIDKSSALKVLTDCLKDAKSKDEETQKKRVCGIGKATQERRRYCSRESRERAWRGRACRKGIRQGSKRGRQGHR